MNVPSIDSVPEAAGALRRLESLEKSGNSSQIFGKSFPWKILPKNLEDFPKIWEFGNSKKIRKKIVISPTYHIFSNILGFFSKTNTFPGGINCNVPVVPGAHVGRPARPDAPPEPFFVVEGCRRARTRHQGHQRAL